MRKSQRPRFVLLGKCKERKQGFFGSKALRVDPSAGLGLLELHLWEEGLETEALQGRCAGSLMGLHS